MDAAVSLGFWSPGLTPWPDFLAEMRTRSRRTAKVATVTPSARQEQAWDEQRLVERAKGGDRTALGKLLTHFGPKLFRAVLLPRLGSEARARDALSATYEKVIERLDRYDWQPCGIYPWLRVVALRTALDMLRASRRELLFQPEDLDREVEFAETTFRREADQASSAVQEQHDLEEARERVQEALGRINPRYAQAIRLRVLEEQPRELVARTMGVSPATFDVLLHRSLAALKKTLGIKASEQEPR